MMCWQNDGDRNGTELGRKPPQATAHERIRVGWWAEVMKTGIQQEQTQQTEKEISVF